MDRGHTSTQRHTRPWYLCNFVANRFSGHSTFVLQTINIINGQVQDYEVGVACNVLKSVTVSICTLSVCLFVCLSVCTVLVCCCGRVARLTCYALPC